MSCSKDCFFGGLKKWVFQSFLKDCFFVGKTVFYAKDWFSDRTGISREVETLCEELSGIYDKNTLMEMYREATAEPYSFMFVRLDAKTRESMFFLRFEAALVPEDVAEE